MAEGPSCRSPIPKNTFKQVLQVILRGYIIKQLSIREKMNAGSFLLHPQCLCSYSSWAHFLQISSFCSQRLFDISRTVL